jgi:hypothetical protein
MKSKGVAQQHQGGDHLKSGLGLRLMYVNSVCRVDPFEAFAKRVERGREHASLIRAGHQTDVQAN